MEAKSVIAVDKVAAEVKALLPVRERIELVTCLQTKVLGVHDLSGL